jgi:4,5-DOPA dioxygenase extradiol
MNRRVALTTLAGAALAGIGCQRPTARTGPAAGRAGSHGRRLPAIFLAHGHPMWTLDGDRRRELGAWARAMPRPESVLVISAHWETAPIAVGATSPVPLVYDFSGFPPELYRQQYPAPGAPELARRVEGLLGARRSVTRQPERGLDHGAYVPLMLMYPEADVPVLQLSLPSMNPADLLAVGQLLAPLRDEGVLIMGSGFLTHNLGMMDMAPAAPTPTWAREFDAWAAEVLGKRDVDALLDYRRRAPGVGLALPTHEHFVPVVVAMGASIDRPEAASFPITGWEAGSLTRRSLQLG